MGRDPDRLSGHPPLAPSVLELADELLLLGIETDRRLARSDRRTDPLVDQTELQITVGMLGSLQGLAIGLQAVPQRTQQMSHGREVNLVAPLTQLNSKPAHALRSPQQHLHRIAATVLRDQALQHHDQFGISLTDRLASTTTPTHPTTLKPLTRVDLPHPLTDRVLSDPARPRHRGDPTTTEHPRLRRRPDPPPPLAQLRRQRPKPLTDQPLIDHAPEVLRPQGKSFTLFIYAPLERAEDVRDRLLKRLAHVRTN